MPHVFLQEVGGESIMYVSERQCMRGFRLSTSCDGVKLEQIASGFSGQMAEESALIAGTPFGFVLMASGRGLSLFNPKQPNRPVFYLANAHPQGNRFPTHITILEFDAESIQWMTYGEDNFFRLWRLDHANGIQEVGKFKDEPAAFKVTERRIQLLASRQALKATSVAHDPHSKIWATGHTDGSIHLWEDDTANHELKQVATYLTAHEGPVRSLAFDTTTKTLGSGGSDGSLRLWCTSTHHGRTPEPVHAHPGGVAQLAHCTKLNIWVSCDTYVGFGKPVNIRFWRADENLNLQALPKLLDDSERGIQYRQAAFDPHSKTWLTGSFNGEVQLWQISASGRTCTHIAGWKADEQDEQLVAEFKIEFSGDLEQFSECLHSQLAEKQHELGFKIHDFEILAASGKSIRTKYDLDGMLGQSFTVTMKDTGRFGRRGWDVFSFDPESRLLLSHQSCVLRLWHVSVDGKTLNGPLVDKDLDDEVTAMAFGETDLLLTGGWVVVTLWRIGTNGCSLNQMDTQQTPHTICSVAYVGSKAWVTGDAQSEIRLWHVGESGDTIVPVVMVKQNYCSQIFGMLFDSTFNFLATSSANTITLWRVCVEEGTIKQMDQREPAHMPYHVEDKPDLEEELDPVDLDVTIDRVAFDVTTKTLASQGSDGQVCLWEVVDSGSKFSLRPAFTPSFKTLVGCFTPQTILFHHDDLLVGYGSGKILSLSMTSLANSGIVRITMGGTHMVSDRINFGELMSSYMPLVQYFGSVASLLTVFGQFAYFGFECVAAIPESSAVHATRKATSSLQTLLIMITNPVTKAVIGNVSAMAMLFLFLTQEKVEDLAFAKGGMWRYAFQMYSLMSQVMTGVALLPVTKALAEGILGQSPAFLRCLSFASCTALGYMARRLINVDYVLANLTCMYSLNCGEDLDLASSNELRRERRVHPLADKSIVYDKAAIFVKIAFVIVVVFIPEEAWYGEMVVSITAVVAGILLLLISLKIDKYFEKERHLDPVIPFGISANGIQVSLCTIMLGTYLMQLVSVMRWYFIGRPKELKPSSFDTVYIAMSICTLAAGLGAAFLRQSWQSPEQASLQEPLLNFHFH